MQQVTVSMSQQLKTLCELNFSNLILTAYNGNRFDFFFSVIKDRCSALIVSLVVSEPLLGQALHCEKKMFSRSTMNRHNVVADAKSLGQLITYLKINHQEIMNHSFHPTRENFFLIGLTKNYVCHGEDGLI